MKQTQNVIKLPQFGRFRKSVVRSSKPMVSPDLLDKLRNKGALLEETRLAVLGVSTFDLRRLEDAGIITLKQLIYWDEMDILAIPHFGDKKVQKLKEDLKSYLTATFNEPEGEFIQLPRMPDSETTSQMELVRRVDQAETKPDSDSELEAFSKSLDKLKKRLGSLESRLIKVRIKIKRRKPNSNDFSTPA